MRSEGIRETQPCPFCGRKVFAIACFPCELNAIRAKAEAQLRIEKVKEAK